MDRPASPADTRSPLVVVTTILGGIGVLVGGLLHLRIWDSDYRDIPAGAVEGLKVVKFGFPVNAAISVVLAIVLVVVAFKLRPLVRRLAVPAAIALQLGSIAALILSRTSSILGWSEKGWTANAKEVLAVEIATATVLVAAAAADRLLARSRTVASG